MEGRVSVGACRFLITVIDQEFLTIIFVSND